MGKIISKCSCIRQQQLEESVCPGAIAQGAYGSCVYQTSCVQEHTSLGADRPNNDIDDDRHDIDFDDDRHDSDGSDDDRHGNCMVNGTHSGDIDGNDSDGNNSDGNDSDGNDSDGDDSDGNGLISDDRANCGLDVANRNDCANDDIGDGYGIHRMITTMRLLCGFFAMTATPRRAIGWWKNEIPVYVLTIKMVDLQKSAHEALKIRTAKFQRNVLSGNFTIVTTTTATKVWVSITLIVMHHSREKKLIEPKCQTKKPVELWLDRYRMWEEENVKVVYGKGDKQPVKREFASKEEKYEWLREEQKKGAGL